MLPPNLRDYPLEIRCPRCEGRARWEEPFELVPNGELCVADAETMPAWGPWRVREKFPSVIRWTPPPRGQGYVHPCVGVVRCGQCHAVALHRLRWPVDAYFQWSVRGVTLYAWDAEHARVLLDYLASTLRDPNAYGGAYRKGLQRLPAAVLDGHARARTAKRIAETLRAHGIPVHPPFARATSPERRPTRAGLARGPRRARLGAVAGGLRKIGPVTVGTDPPFRTCAKSSPTPIPTHPRRPRRSSADGGSRPWAPCG